MQPVRIAINIHPRDIPDLLCANTMSEGRMHEYVAAIAEAVAEELDLEEFLARPGRIHELRRLLWERSAAWQGGEHPGPTARPAVGPI